MSRTFVFLALLPLLGCRGQFDVSQYVIANAESGTEAEAEAGAESGTESGAGSESESESESETETETDTDTEGTTCLEGQLALGDGCFGVRETIGDLAYPSALVLAQELGSFYLLVNSADGLYPFRRSPGIDFSPLERLGDPAFALAAGHVDPFKLYFAALTLENTRLYGAPWQGDIEEDGVIDAGGRTLLLADLDNDGDDDLVIAGTSLHVLLNKGGSWQLETYQFAPRGLAVADVNQDGLRDLALSDTDDRIWILVNDGAGGFTMSPAWSYSGLYAHHLAFTSFNADPQRPVLLALGDKDVFQLHVSVDVEISLEATHPVGYEPSGFVVGPVDGDDLIDVVTVSRITGELSILRGTTTGFEEELRLPPYALQTAPEAIGIADFDSDGRSEVVVAMSGIDEIVIFGYVD